MDTYPFQLQGIESESFHLFTFYAIQKILVELSEASQFECQTKNKAFYEIHFTFFHVFDSILDSFAKYRNLYETQL